MDVRFIDKQFGGETGNHIFFNMFVCDGFWGVFGMFCLELRSLKWRNWKVE